MYSSLVAIASFSSLVNDNCKRGHAESARCLFARDMAVQSLCSTLATSIEAKY